jgi:hypothetical protein
MKSLGCSVPVVSEGLVALPVALRLGFCYALSGVALL